MKNYIINFWESIYLKILLLLIIAGLLLINYYELSIFIDGQIDVKFIGTVGDWITGLISALALFIAVESLITTKKDFKAKSVKDELNEFKELTKVYSWIKPVFDEVSTEIIKKYELILFNDLDIPIYVWDVSFEINSDENFNQITYGPLLPHQEKKIAIDKKKYSEIPKPNIRFLISNGSNVMRDYNGIVKLV